MVGTLERTICENGIHCQIKSEVCRINSSHGPTCCYCGMVVRGATKKEDKTAESVDCDAGKHCTDLQSNPGCMVALALDESHKCCNCSTELFGKEEL